MKSLAVEFPGVVWLLLPLLGAAALHAACIRMDAFPGLRIPVDGGASFRQRRVFGANKTWRGILAVGAGCALVFVLQADVLHAVHVFRDMELFDYGKVNAPLFGFALGVAAELSELPNSFIKRQLDIPPGGAGEGRYRHLFFVVDQLDVLAGYWLLLASVMAVDIVQLLLSLGIVLAAHPALSLLGVMLGIRRSVK